MLQEQAEVMKRKSRLATASTASGLKLWHNFAVGVLQYPPSNTLPPQKPADILKFSYLFNNKGTAANYIGTIKWACDNKGLSVEWYDGEVKQLLRGVTNVANVYFDGSMGAEFLLEQAMVNMLLVVFQGHDQWREVIITTVGWEFLLRMQSEAMVIYIGQESDSYQLPAGRDNGLWIDPDGQLALRLRRRKNRREGCTMRRACRCSQVGREFCAVHIFKDYFKNRDVGDLVAQMTPTEYTRSVKRTLQKLNIPNYDKFTLKAFRAGRATELAKQNVAAPEILEMGGWKTGAAAARYVRGEEVDPNKFLNLLHAESEEEM